MAVLGNSDLYAKGLLRYGSPYSDEESIARVMERPAHLLTGFVWLIVGLGLNLSRTRIYTSVVEEQLSRSNLPFSPGSVKVYRAFTYFVVLVVGIGALLASFNEFTWR